MMMTYLWGDEEISLGKAGAAELPWYSICNIKPSASNGHLNSHELRHQMEHRGLKKIRSTSAANRSTLLILNRFYFLFQQQNVVRSVNTAALAVCRSQVGVMTCLKHYLLHSLPKKHRIHAG